MVAHTWAGHLPPQPLHCRQTGAVRPATSPAARSGRAWASAADRRGAAPALFVQLVARLTDRRVAVEKELAALGEEKKGMNDIFRHCRGFERAYSVLLEVRLRCARAEHRPRNRRRRGDPLPGSVGCSGGAVAAGKRCR